jgi:hypothetical protein
MYYLESMALFEINSRKFGLFTFTFTLTEAGDASIGVTLKGIPGRETSDLFLYIG